MKTDIRLTRIAIAFALLLLSFGANAQQWYHVELVVFERFSGVNAEQWPTMNQIRNGSLSPQMANKYIQPASIDSLAGVAQRLNNSSNYRVHFHKAWQQSMLSKRSAKGVQISSANNLVEGQLKLYRVNYLHADIDLWFKENGTQTSKWSDTLPQGIETGGPRNPHLTEIRRVKSKELIYFDHPRLPAILQITPVAAPAAAVSETPESYSLPETTKSAEAQ
ncbi:CsiV family protein [Methylophaga sp.]|uniref:CsiV family protein n=1 Tax=Methylophaga sp. TaxID=2024840 RepID=UPI003F6966B4